MKLCVTEREFPENFFAPKIGKMDQVWLKMGQNGSANPIAGFLNQLFLQKKTHEIAKYCFNVDKNSQKLKDDQKFFGWTWSKMGVANMVSGL